MSPLRDDATDVDAASGRGDEDDGGVDFIIIMATLIALFFCILIAYVLVMRKRRRRRKASITMHTDPPESIKMENMGRALNSRSRADFPEPSKMSNHHSPNRITRFTAAGSIDDDNAPRAGSYLTQANVGPAPSHTEPPGKDDNGITWANGDADNDITWDDNVGLPDPNVVVMPASRSMQFLQPVTVASSSGNPDGYTPIDIDAVVKEKRNQPMALGQELDAAAALQNIAFGTIANGLQYDDDSDDDGTYRDTVPDPLAQSQHPHLSYLPEDPKQQKYLKVTGAGWEPSNVSVDDHLENDESSDDDRQYGYADVAVTGDNGWVDYDGDSDGFDGDDIAAPAADDDAGQQSYLVSAGARDDDYTVLARHLERVASKAEPGTESHEDYI